MLRTYIMVVVLLGIGASMVGHLPASVTSMPHRTINLPAPASSRFAPAPSVQSVNELDQSIELTRDANGYFYADVQINGAPVHMLVDTGATGIALSRDDAQQAGIATSIAMNDVIGQGADGAIRGQQVTLDRVSLGGRTVETLPAIVLNSGSQSLLGQSFLGKFASVTIEGDKMILR